MRVDVEDLKSISVCDLFCKVTLDIARLLPKANDGKRNQISYNCNNY